jgi:hypothetical protein
MQSISHPRSQLNPLVPPISAIYIDQFFVELFMVHEFIPDRGRIKGHRLFRPYSRHCFLTFQFFDEF